MIDTESHGESPHAAAGATTPGTAVGRCEDRAEPFCRDDLDSQFEVVWKVVERERAGRRPARKRWLRRLRRHTAEGRQAGERVGDERERHLRPLSEAAAHVLVAHHDPAVEVLVATDDLETHEVGRARVVEGRLGVRRECLRAKRVHRGRRVHGQLLGHLVREADRRGELLGEPRRVLRLAAEGGEVAPHGRGRVCCGLRRPQRAHRKAEGDRLGRLGRPSEGWPEQLMHCSSAAALLCGDGAWQRRFGESAEPQHGRPPVLQVLANRRHLREWQLGLVALPGTGAALGAAQDFSRDRHLEDPLRVGARVSRETRCGAPQQAAPHEDDGVGDGVGERQRDEQRASVRGHDADGKVKRQLRGIAP
mmetsp:Transcript_5108/g.15554  ORF Transcript_5108/g.15554 Transcript_5108/m.15554 type:complete len:364 (+) Transcript_5108:2340-3431(+)